MRKLIFAVLIAMISGAGVASERVVVIANVNSASMSLSKSQIRDLFMSGITKVNGVDVTLFPVDISPGSKARTAFNTRVIGLPESRIQSYWAQMKFSGRLNPPKQVEDVKQMIEFLLSNEGAVGYVPEGTALPDNLQIVHDAF